MTYTTTFRRWMEGVSFVVDVLDETTPVFEEKTEKEPPKPVEKAPAPRKGGRRARNWDEKRILEMYESGETMATIAKEMGCSIAPIRKIVAKVHAGDDGKLPHKFHREIKQDIDTGKISALHNAGWNEKKIADEMACEPEMIKGILKELKGAEATNEVPES